MFFQVRFGYVKVQLYTVGRLDERSRGSQIALAGNLYFNPNIIWSEYNCGH